MANKAARDIRTTTGRNLNFLAESSGLNPWEFCSARIKMELVKKEMVEVPPLDLWRVRYLASLMEKRQVADYMGSEKSADYLTELIDSLCVN